MTMFTVKVRVRYRNPMRHGIRGETTYRVVRQAKDAAAAGSRAVADLENWFPTHFPYLEVSSTVALSSKATPQEKVELMEEDSVRPY